MFETIGILFVVIVVSIVCAYPMLTLLRFFAWSDYGFKDTWNWNWKREKLWIELILIPIGIALWWWLIGIRIDTDIVFSIRYNW